MSEEWHIEQIVYAQTWLLRQEVLWPDKPLAFVQLPDDPDGMHYGLFEDSRLCSVISLFPDVSTKEARFRKFATKAEKQGQGMGSALFRYMLQACQHEPIDTLWCDARVSQLPFYQRFGMRAEGAIFRKSGIEYQVMKLYLSHR